MEVLNQNVMKKLYILLLLASSLVIPGCLNSQKKERVLKSTHNFQELDQRVSTIEKQLKPIGTSENSTLPKAKINIKSVTFRIGTEDDRLRIYWSDGRKTDLPCTQESNIWACG